MSYLRYVKNAQNYGKVIFISSHSHSSFFSFYFQLPIYVKIIIINGKVHFSLPFGFYFAPFYPSTYCTLCFIEHFYLFLSDHSFDISFSPLFLSSSRNSSSNRPHVYYFHLYCVFEFKPCAVFHLKLDLIYDIWSDVVKFLFNIFMVSFNKIGHLDISIWVKWWTA